MKVQKIKSRSVVFTYQTVDEWDLNVHLIVGDKYNYIIDTGFGAGSMVPVMDYINKDNPIVVINTHYHWDHIWGNCVFEDCMIVSHRLCREMISEQWDEMIQNNRKYVDGKAEKCMPNVVFEDELRFLEDGIRLIYTPGHTIDCISVLDEKDKVINLGDNVGDTVDEIVPCVDSDTNIYIESLEKVKTLDFDTCVSGHNIVLGKDVLDQILEKL